MINRILLLIILLSAMACNQKTDTETSNTYNTTLTDTTMNRLGLIGGTSWHSTIEYYKYINEAVNKHFGNNTNPPLMVFTVNQAEVHKYQIENKWDKIADLFIEGGKRLEAAGAQKLMFCANTPHKIYNQVEKELDIPILHIADATADAIKGHNVDKVCFLGTKYSMKENFISQRIADNGIEVLVPTQDKVIDELHRIIIEELTYGKIDAKSKKYVIDVIESFIDKGAKGVILGCTEFPLMIHKEDLPIPIFNTTEIHALAGVQFILENHKE